MGKVFAISDFHFGHLSVATRRGFKNIEDHDNHIIKEYNKIVGKKDTTWILGDISMEKRNNYFLLDSLNGYKKVILGNHDKPQHSIYILNYVNSIAGMVKYKNAMLTHCPIHPSELDYEFNVNIHGHVHENSLKDNRYKNVSCEAIDYKPQEILNLLN